MAMMTGWPDVTPKPLTEKGKAAVIRRRPSRHGGAYFLRRGGMEVTLFEQTGSLAEWYAT